jgi:flagellar hook-associated protein 3 FlgL
MRVSDRWMMEQNVRHMQSSQGSLLDLQEKVSSTKAFQRISENPTAASAALSLRSGLRAAKSYQEVAKTSDDWMSAMDWALNEMETTATKAITLTEQGGNDTLDDRDRQAIAAELDGLLSHALEAGNAQHEGKYLFSGFEVNTKPFTLVDGATDSVSYAGDDGLIQRSMGPNHTVTINIHGQHDLADPAQPSAFSRLFQGLITARDALANNDGAAIRASIQGLSSALDKVSELRTLNGARQAQLGLRIQQLDDNQLELKTMLAGKEDVNMAEAVAQLRLQENVFQAALEVSKRTLATANLFEYLG